MTAGLSGDNQQLSDKSRPNKNGGTCPPVIFLFECQRPLQIPADKDLITGAPTKTHSVISTESGSIDICRKACVFELGFTKHRNQVASIVFTAGNKAMMMVVIR
jgi:hypothetical protein